MRASTAVGRWVFEGPDPGRGANPGELADLLAAALRILARRRLLEPRRLVVREWVSPEGVALPATVERQVDRGVLDAATLAAAVVTTAPLGCTPSRFGVEGPTLLTGADGEERWFDDALVVDAHAWVGVLLTVETFVDAWLEHDLLGRRQPEVHRFNAPGLTAALTEIASLPGVALTEGESTRHAVAVGSRLVNHTDVTGSVVASTDDPERVRSL